MKLLAEMSSEWKIKREVEHKLCRKWQRYNNLKINCKPIIRQMKSPNVYCFFNIILIELKKFLKHTMFECKVLYFCHILGQYDIVGYFELSFRNIDDVLSLNNLCFGDFIHRTYWSNYTTNAMTSFRIVNFPPICGNILSAPTYGVFM